MASAALSLFREIAPTDHFNLRQSDKDFRAVFLLKRGRGTWCASPEQWINNMQPPLVCTGSQSISGWSWRCCFWSVGIESRLLQKRTNYVPDLKSCFMLQDYLGATYIRCVLCAFFSCNRLSAAQVNIADANPSLFLKNCTLEQHSNVGTARTVSLTCVKK